MSKELYETDPIFYQDGFQKFLRLNSGRCVFVFVHAEMDYLEYRYEVGEGRLIVKKSTYESNKEMWIAFKEVTPDTILSTLGSVLENPPTTPTQRPLNGLPH